MRRELAATAVMLTILGVSACASSRGTADSRPPDETLGGVGVLPSPTGTIEVTAGTSTTTSTLAPSTTSTSLVPIGTFAEGNRVIVIGDSILASTARRYTNDMCEALVPLGWQVEVDAETGRFIDFADRVLDARLSAGWDAAVVLLGSNYDGNASNFRRRLDETVTRLAPRPVLLLTVTEFTRSRADVNAIITDIVDQYDHVHLADWATASVEQAGLLGGDGLHLTDQGRTRISDFVAQHLGPPVAGAGACLSSEFIDDSAGGIDGTTTTSVGATTTRSTPRSTTTTRPTSTTRQTTTTRPASTTSTSSTTTSTTTTTTEPPTTPPPG